MTGIRLAPLECDDREQFILDNQEAFNYGALEEFGMRDDHLEEDGQIISRETIEKSIDSGIAYRIMDGGFTRKWKSGKRLHRILKPETFIFMLTAVTFI